jgi:hypothetical protein
MTTDAEYWERFRQRQAATVPSARAPRATSERDSRIYWDRVRGMTLTEIGQKHGISRERVRGIYDSEQNERVRRRLRQERRWLIGQGLGFLAQSYNEWWRTSVGLPARPQ